MIIDFEPHVTKDVCFLLVIMRALIGSSLQTFARTCALENDSMGSTCEQARPQQRYESLFAREARTTIKIRR